jgi:acetylornithine deacetylase/succinyl-diaminopimelate desuccinylase-like protein
MTAVEKLLSDLIALPSVNPAFAPPDDRHAGEQRVAEFLAAVAAKAGLDVELRTVLPGRPNLFARLSPAQRAKRRILLAPHLDTVPAASMSQFVPRKKSGRLFGRGACDTKGSIAVMLSALIELAARPQRPGDTEIIFAGLIDEENAQAGSRALIADGWKADLAIVGEPTQLRVVTAHTGDLWLQLETRGKSAHASRPELGRNAIQAMAPIVDAIQTRYAAQLRRRRHPLLGTATVNVGMIRGGTQANIVPENCAIVLDRRTLPGETEASVRREISGFLRRQKLRAQFRNLKFAPCLALETNPRLPLVRQFFRSTGQTQPAGVHYFCDAAVLAGGGIPSVVFGPGDIGHAHSANEWVPLASLERGKDMLVRFFSSLP